MSKQYSLGAFPKIDIYYRDAKGRPAYYASTMSYRTLRAAELGLAHKLGQEGSSLDPLTIRAYWSK